MYFFKYSAFKQILGKILGNVLQILPILQFNTKNILQILPIQIEIEIEFFSETCSYNIHLYIF